MTVRAANPSRDSLWRPLCRKLPGVNPARRSRLLIAVGLAAASAAVAIPVTRAAPASAYTVVVRGLDNPRQLAWAADGRTLLVAEAGRGGTEDCGPAVGPFFPVCSGSTGAVTLIRHPEGVPEHRHLAADLPSQAESDTGLDATGPHGVAMLGGRVMTSVGQLWKARPEQAGGSVLDLTTVGRPTIATFDTTHDPGQLAASGGRLFVADGAAAALWRIDAIGTITPLTRFDARDSVDALGAGRSGRLYVATSVATSGPYSLRWRLWRVDPISGAKVALRAGAGVLTGLAFGPDNSLWVAGRTAQTGVGFVNRYRPDGRVSSYPVPDPGGIAVDSGGRVYVAAFSHGDFDGSGRTSNSGRVLRLNLSARAAPAPSVPGVTHPLAPIALPIGVEDLSPPLPQVSCDPVAKPGVLAFRAMVLATYGRGRNGGIVRACDDGGASFHKEGRAWDWMLDLGSFPDRDAGAHMIQWLMAEDAANARRLGITYIIWQQKVWYSFRAQDGWLPYTGPNPHLDHIHFSFSWAGAMQRTSWWTGKVSPTEYGPCPPAPDQSALPYGEAINVTPCPSEPLFPVHAPEGR